MIFVLCIWELCRQHVQLWVFTPGRGLSRIAQQWIKISDRPACPRCQVPIRFRSIPGSGGENFNYYHCPTRYWGTKCYGTCPADEVKEYLRRKEKQTYPCYKNMDMVHVRGKCDLSLVLATSHSVNNPEWLYLKCSGWTCKFFQWINETPRGLAKDIFIDRHRY